MRRRTRALIGAFFIVGFVVVYALAAMTLAQAPALQNASGGVQGVIYAVMGMAWILPLMPLIRWMERRDPA
ncbi:MAG TPA: DUF2842 domain-containing protein [Beijerinckiaceae bacterium]|nr:DUF2842 domain-containing protein [Beijerinckiaceae bacterium]